MPLSQYGLNQMANALISQTLYLALCPTLPDPSYTGSTLVEVTGTGYSRMALSPANWTDTGIGVRTYNSSLLFTAGSNWGSVGYYALCTASTGGNLIGYGSLGTVSIVSSGASLLIPASSITAGVQ